MNSMWKKWPRTLIGIPFAAVLILSSCRSIPVRPFPEVIDWLPEESNLILRLHVQGNEELTELFLSLAGVNSETMQPFIKRTALIALGAEITGETLSFLRTPIHAVAIGRWPLSLLGGILGRDWMRSRKKPFVWHGPDNIQLTAPSNEELVFSHNRLETLLQNRKFAGVEAKRWSNLPQNADLAILASDAVLVNQLMPVSSGRVKALSIALRKTEPLHYALRMNIYVEEESLAPAMALALRLAISARFGTSSTEEERSLLPMIQLEVQGNVLALSIASVNLSILRSLTRGIIL